MTEFFGDPVEATDELQLDHDLILTQLYSDWTLYQEVLFHLLTNAIKFSSSNETLQIQLRVLKSKDY
jgi:hypothetical protein